MDQFIAYYRQCGPIVFAYYRQYTRMKICPYQEYQNQKSGLGIKLTERAVSSEKICSASSKVCTKEPLSLAQMIAVGERKI